MKTLCYAQTPLPLYATLYPSKTAKTRAVLLYFHGGGLIYGTRDDLPKAHLDQFLNEGFAILSFDYRLAPVTKLPTILSDVHLAIDYYIHNAEALFGKALPYFLWGRSAGAYLCLLAARSPLAQKPLGILNYYGYGLLCERWYETPAAYYRQFPRLRPAEIKSLSGDTEITTAPLTQRYALYVHARQTGKWLSMVYGGSRLEMLRQYSLGDHDTLKDFPPVFLAHSTLDPDVPFTESQLLSQALPTTECFTVKTAAHDFDRLEGTRETVRLLGASVLFLERQLG